MKPQKYRKDIQVFRGIAVIAVLLYHARGQLFPQGYLGVDVFFVISGYVVAPLFVRVLVGQSDGGNVLSNLVGFYKRRFFRLAPAIGATLGISAVTMFFFGNFSDFARFAKQGIATLMLVGNWGASAFSGNYFSPNPNPLIHTWSLSVEEQIYLLLPILLIVLVRNRQRIERDITRVYFGVFFISLTLCVATNAVGDLQIAFYSPLTRIWEFCLGGLAFFLAERRGTALWKVQRPLQAAIVFTLIAILFSPLSFDPRIGSVLACLTGFSVLTFGSLNIFSRVFSNALTWVGDRSYSIYLVHMPIVYLFLYSAAIPHGALFRFRTVSAVFLSIGLGALCFTKIEQKYRIRPERKVVKSMRSVLSKFVAFPLVLLLIILFSSASLSTLNGIPRPAKIPAWAWDSKCIFFGGIPTVYPPCAYLVPHAKGSVLLTGDSHAASASKGVVEAANKLKINVFISVHAGCPFFFLTEAEAAKLKIVYSAWCLVHNHQMYQWIKQNHPLAVIYTFRSSSLIPNDLGMDRERYNKFLAANLLKLHALVPNIIQIGPNPDFLAPQTLVEHLLNPHLDVAREPNLDNQFWKDQSKITGVIYIDAISIFCNGKYCRNKDGNRWLYEDDNHLSIAGSRLLEPALNIALKKVSSSNFF